MSGKVFQTVGSVKVLVESGAEIGGTRVDSARRSRPERSEGGVSPKGVPGVKRRSAIGLGGGPSLRSVRQATNGEFVG